MKLAIMMHTSRSNAHLNKSSDRGKKNLKNRKIKKNPLPRIRQKGACSGHNVRAPAKDFIDTSLAGQMNQTTNKAKYTIRPTHKRPQN